MKKCKVFACPNNGIQYYSIDPGIDVWLCEDCVNRAEQLVQQEIEKQGNLVQVS